MGRLFEQGLDVDPILTHKVAMGLAGNTTKNSTWQKIVTWLQTALQDATHRFTTDTEKAEWNSVKHEKIDISTWDMDADAFVDVAHGIADFKKIISTTGIVFNDTLTNSYSFPYVEEDTNDVEISIRDIDSTNVRIKRKTGGTFDSAAFDDNVINRGYLLIHYID